MSRLDVYIHFWATQSSCCSTNTPGYAGHFNQMAGLKQEKVSWLNDFVMVTWEKLTYDNSKD